MVVVILEPVVAHEPPQNMPVVRHHVELDLGVGASIGRLQLNRADQYISRQLLVVVSTNPTDNSCVVKLQNLNICDVQRKDSGIKLPLRKHAGELELQPGDTLFFDAHPSWHAFLGGISSYAVSIKPLA